MRNEQIAEAFEQMADLLEFRGANPFRVRAYRKGARHIRELSEPLSAIHEAGQPPLTEIEGVGKDLAEKITVLIEQGELPQLQELKEAIPASVLQLLRVPGLGPRKAAAIYEQLGISNLDALQAACETGEIRGLKGFGEKTEQAILAGIRVAATADHRIRWAEADAIAAAIREHLAGVAGIKQLEMAGSYRRGKESVGDLDVLVVSTEPQAVMQKLGEFPGLAETIVQGGTKMSIRLDSGLQVDLRVVAEESFGAAWQYFTGSKDHNVVLRGLAKQRGLKINEYGVYRIEGDQEIYVAGRSEADVYGTLGLPCFPPELREARREFEWAATGELPELIEGSDLRGDLHMHTTASDGKASLEEMVAAAEARGYEYIAITDHSKRVSMAGGLDGEQLRAQWREIDAINERLSSRFRVFKGVECDILEKGGMDLPDDVLADADWVLASIHYGQQQSAAKLTDRILTALRNPHVRAIAHPTGRIIGRRPPYSIDFEAIFQAAQEHGKLLELNASPKRLDLNDVACAAAKQRGIPIVINTDAHSLKGLDAMRGGVLQARRGGLTKADVANTRTRKHFEKLLGL